MTEIKIIESKNLKEFENDLNEFFFLANWFNREVFYFKKEQQRKTQRAIIILKPMEFKDQTYFAIRTLDQNDRLKKDSELKERLTKSLNKFYPERQKEVEK